MGQFGKDYAVRSAVMEGNSKSCRQEEQDMSKDFAEIAHDVIAGVGLLQRDAPITMKAFGTF